MDRFVRAGLGCVILFCAGSLFAGAWFLGATGAASGGASMVADPTCSGCGVGACPQTYTYSTSTTGAHLFYIIDSTGTSVPTHSGDTATGATVRIGSNSGSVASGGNAASTKVMNMVGYQSGLSDSNIVTIDICGP